MPEGIRTTGDDPRKRAAAQRAQPTLPTPAGPPRGAQVSFAARQINQGYRPMCAGKSCADADFAANGEKRIMGTSDDAGDEPAGAAGGWQHKTVHDRRRWRSGSVNVCGGAECPDPPWRS